MIQQLNMENRLYYFFALVLCVLYHSTTQAKDHEPAVNYTRSFEVNLLDDGTPELVVLHIQGSSINSPLTWSVTVQNLSTVLYHVERDDTWMDKFFNDDGYMNGCKGYIECKKQWYFHDLEESLHKSIRRESNFLSALPDEWKLSTLNVLANEYLAKIEINESKRALIIKEMISILSAEYAHVSVAISPVQDSANYVYVPSIGSFVPFWGD